MKRAWLALCVLAGVLTASTQAEQPPVDLALVLAVDCSGSVDKEEYRLQIDGLAAALTDREVLAAIAAGPEGRIAINVMLWEDAHAPRRKTGWRTVASERDALLLAGEIRSFQFSPGGGTGMGAALGEAIGLIQNSGIDATRHVIDVSGDGRESWNFEDPRMFLQQVKAILRNQTITVNGLAIVNNEPDLVDYYHDNVIFGPNAFVLEAKDFESFSAAMKIKLLREIAQNVSAAPPHSATTAIAAK
jgi:hypothetical protein